MSWPAKKIYHPDPGFYQTILESLEEFGVFTVDLNGMITSWNAGAGHIFGYKSDEVLGFSGTIIFTREDLDAGVPDFEFSEAMNKGRAFDERFHVRKDGSVFWGSGMVFPLRDTDGTHIGYTKVLRDLSQRKQSENEIVEARRYAESIVETSREPIIILNADYTIAAASHAFYNLFGLQIPAAENRNLFLLLGAHVDTGGFKELMQQHDSFDGYEFTIPGSTSLAPKIVSMSYRKVYQTFKSIGQILVTFTDMTDQRRQDQTRDDFINFASHELKTPVTLIRGYSQLLMQMGDANNVRLQDTLHRIGTQSERLSKLTTYLLEASGLKTGSLRMKKESIILLDLVMDIINGINQATQSDQIRLGDMDVARVLADPLRIGQVVTNLINNAVRYSPDKAPIEVSITNDDTRGITRVSVTDQGSGIAPEQQLEIFNRYSRTPEARKKKGFGLGLYISAEIIKAHEGSIGVISDGLKGSVFYFELRQE